ncbi:glutaminase family protein [Halomontanus rarus]|uniref:glutaminase family protein n=1 Tax=Halomontanus rarus TaxID=3034020 RepID=UPI0023E7A987|nr:glutaminase family protein [Halovivax sp. TS33]
MSTVTGPAVPLITHHPYFSVWSPTDELHEGETIHWTGASHGLLGIVSIDGRRYRFAGRTPSAEVELPTIPQRDLEVRPTTTAYVFETDCVELVVEFTSPLLLDDLDVLARPASYVTVSVRSIDAHKHEVDVYFDVTAELCVDTPDQSVTWSRTPLSTGSAMEAMRVGTVEQDVLGHVGDDVRIDWGYCYLVPPTTVESTTAIGEDVRTRFRTAGELPDEDASDDPRPVGEGPPVLACTFALDVDPGDDRSATLTLAYDERQAIEYFGEALEPYWRRHGDGATELLERALEQRKVLLERCAAFDERLERECLARGGADFAELAALAYRQSIAAHALVEYEEDVLFLSKECFSNGCIATVDVTYPSAPLYYRFEPELVKGMLRPVFRYAASDDWPYAFAPHDLGTYPKANGQVYGRDSDTGEFDRAGQMPIEECGNVLLVTTAVCLLEDDPSFAKTHWDRLTEWVEYLVEHGYDPGEQLCTDDFTGHLSHNANLSLKAIFAIAGFGLLCRLVGNDAEAETYLDTAQRMAAEWERDADDGDHYRLAFDRPDTWSLKYNLVWDRLFDLDLFDESVREAERRQYLTQLNDYGVPLDSRESYTKLDWEVWAAMLVPEESDAESLFRAIRRFLEETPDRVPLTDWYDTRTAEQQNFQHRSVVGGVFLPLLDSADFSPDVVADDA